MSTNQAAQVTPSRHSAWIVSFGPVGSGSDGYLIRAEANALALASLDYDVHILEVSTRTQRAVVRPNVEVYPAFPPILGKPRFLGGAGFLSLLRAQLALTVGLLRNWRSLRSADVVLVQGGLLALSFGLRLFSRSRPRTVVFDPVTVMSALHRDSGGACSLQCKLRRFIWRILEIFSVWSSDVTVAFGAEDAARLAYGRVEVVPHAVLTQPSPPDVAEDPNLLGFLGGGRVGPNRDAVDFIATSVLTFSGLESVRCIVIGNKEGYNPDLHKRMEFVGFVEDLPEALAAVSVCCAPMDQTGGPSTKVLDCLMNGKRTVCTAEAARGIISPPRGLWIAERDGFAEAVLDALHSSWPPSRARALHDWMVGHHGFPALRQAWENVLTDNRVRG